MSKDQDDFKRKFMLCCISESQDDMDERFVEFLEMHASLECAKESLNKYNKRYYTYFIIDALHYSEGKTK